jgi:hypothetical protein
MNLSFTGKTSLLNNQENPKKKPQKDKTIKNFKIMAARYVSLLLTLVTN